MPIESVFYLLLIKVGLLLAAGRFIDFLMSQSEKKRFRGWLEEWWYRFEYLEWPTLGRAEATAAIEIWDRIVGPRLFSVHRLGVASFVVIASATLSVLTADDPKTNQDAGMLFVVLLVLVATSFSFTRFLSTLAIRAPERHFGAVFFALLGTHIALFLLWRPITRLLYQTIGWVVSNYAGLVVVLFIVIAFMWFERFITKRDLHQDFAVADSSELPADHLRSRQASMRLFKKKRVVLLLVGATPAIGFLGLIIYHAPAYIWLELAYKLVLLPVTIGQQIPSLVSAIGVYLSHLTTREFWSPDFRLITVQDYCDFATNGLRIAFSLVFLGSFLLNPFLKKAISRVWARLVESDTPIIGTALGGISAFAVIVHDALSLFSRTPV